MQKTETEKTSELHPSGSNVDLNGTKSRPDATEGPYEYIDELFYYSNVKDIQIHAHTYM